MSDQDQEETSGGPPPPPPPPPPPSPVPVGEPGPFSAEGATPAPGYVPGAPARNDPMAVVAFVLSLAGIILFGIVLEPVAIVLGAISRRRIIDSQGALKGQGLATAAIVIGIIGTLLALVGLLFLLSS